MIFCVSGVQKWRGETRGGQDVPLQYNAQTGSIGASAAAAEAVYFVAPGRGGASGLLMNWIIFDLGGVLK